MWMALPPWNWAIPFNDAICQPSDLPDNQFKLHYISSAMPLYREFVTVYFADSHRDEP